MTERVERSPEAGVRWHPYADIFPWIEGEAFKELKADIAKNGVLEPVVFMGDAILDGRNRYMAARDLGIDYPRTEYKGDDPLGFVLSKNLTRRHLSESQRAMVAAKLAKLPAHRPAADKSANLPTSDVSQPAAATMLNVSERSVRTAKAVQEHGIPELARAVEVGEVSVSAAAEVAGLPKEEQSKIVAQGPDAVKEAAKESRKARGKKPDDAEWERQQEEARDQLPDDVKQSIAAAAAAKAAKSARPGSGDDRIDDLERTVIELENENAKLKAELKKFEAMRLEYERGGFAEVIAGLGEQIRVLKTRVSAESREKVKNLNAMEFWKKEAIKLGYSRDTVLSLDEPANG